MFRIFLLGLTVSLLIFFWTVNEMAEKAFIRPVSQDISTILGIEEAPPVRQTPAETSGFPLLLVSAIAASVGGAYWFYRRRKCERAPEEINFIVPEGDTK